MKTDNTNLNKKIAIRKFYVKNNQIVLDCFSGGFKIWGQLKKSYNLDVIRIDKKRNLQGLYFLGNNQKYMKLISISDIIDLDSYGVPFSQLDYIVKHKNQLKKDVVIFLTYNQSIYGGLPYKMLFELGYTQEMITKCPTLFFRNPIEKLTNYLTKNKFCDKIIIYTNNKGINYIVIEKIKQ